MKITTAICKQQLEKLTKKTGWIRDKKYKSYLDDGENIIIREFHNGMDKAYVMEGDESLVIDVVTSKNLDGASLTTIVEAGILNHIRTYPGPIWNYDVTLNEAVADEVTIWFDTTPPTRVVYKYYDNGKLYWSGIL